MSKGAGNVPTIIQMGLFMDGDGIPLVFSLFPGNANEQPSLKPLEKKVLGDFGCQKFIYRSDAGLGLESIRKYNHMGEPAYIITQSLKKLKKEEKEWALNPQRFKRVSDNTPVNITKLPADDKGLYYKDEPYTTKKLHQRLIVTFLRNMPFIKNPSVTNRWSGHKRCWIQEIPKRAEKTE